MQAIALRRAAARAAASVAARRAVHSSAPRAITCMIKGTEPHGPEEPHFHHASPAAEAYLKPGQQTFDHLKLFRLPTAEEPYEDWESIHYFTLFATVLIAAYAYYYRPNTNVRDWAKDEAEERMRRRAAGLPVEYGVNYAGIRYMKENGVLSVEEAEELEGGKVPAPYVPTVQHQ